MKRLNYVLTDKLHISQLLYSSAAVLALILGPTWSAGAQDQRPLPQAKAKQQTQAKQPTQAKRQVQAKQQTQLRDTVDEGPDITVEQPPPTVTVHQPKPTVTVTQKPPRVTVKQPAPQIQVNMPEPQVSIEQAKPDVQIQMPEPTVRIQQAKPEVSLNQAPPDVRLQEAQPRVRIQEATPKLQFEQAPEPMVTVEQERPEVTVQRAQQQAQTLMSMTGDDIVGEQLVDSQGKKIGEVVDMVVSKQNKHIFAVVDIGGAGAGKAKGVLAPIQVIKLAQGKLTASASKQAVAKGPAYNEGKYQPIKLGIPIREYASVTAGKK